MMNRFAQIMAVAAVLAGSASLTAQVKPRVIVLTDIENEPDDSESMVRFLAYSNQWDVEALVATTSVHQRSRVAPEKIREIIDAYAQVRANLLKHEPGYPEPAYLLSVLREGRPAYGMAAVGEGKDSPGSDAIIQAASRDDPRPVWVLVWGGPNCLAQALWKVRATRSPGDVDKFVSSFGCTPSRTRTTADRGSARPFPVCSISPVLGFTPAAHIITPLGAASAATGFTAGSPAPTSAS